MSERRYKYIVNDPSGGYIVERSIKAKATARYDYITDRGDYVATESYEERDIVHHGGRTWVCLKPAQGIAPGTDPAVWAEVGSGRGSKLVPDRSTIVILESKTAEISVSAVDADGAPLPDINASELYEWETDGATQTAQPNRISVEVTTTDTLRIYTYTVRHESIAHGAQIHVYAVDLATLVQRKDTAKLNELLRVIGVSDPEAYARVVQALTNIKAPYIDKTTHTWWEWDAGQGKYVDTGVSAEGEATYSVTLSSYERVIKEGGEGLRQELKVVTGEKQVTTQGKEVVTSQYSLSAHITVLRGSKELLYSDTVEEGTYTAILRAHGLSASVNAGNIVVTHVGDKGGHVDIEVNCEGKSVITKRFSVVIAKDGERGEDGRPGRDGVGISEVIELYGAGTETQEPTDWFLGHWQVVLTEEKPCLWNKELIKWSNGGSPTETRRHVVYRKTKDGTSGALVENIEEWYAVSDSDTTPPPDTHGTWSTTPPRMSESTPYLWNYSVTYFDNNTHFASPKIVIGRWGADGKDGKDGKDAHSPKIVGGTWWVWDDAQGRYVDTHDPAQGESGENGKSPKIQNGTWWVWDGEKWVDTGVKAKGDKGADGKDGRGVDLVVKEWAKTSDPDNPPAQGSSLWSSIPPKPEAGKYIWERTKTVMTDNNVQYTTPVRVELTGVSKALAEAFETSTEIKGGLIATTMLLVRNALGKIRAYFSGAGNKTNDIAFAAGVENFGLPNETQATYIKQNGDAKFGEMYMDAKGQAYAMRQGLRYLIVGGQIPTLQELINGEGDNVTINSLSEVVTVSRGVDRLIDLSTPFKVKNANVKVSGSVYLDLLYDIPKVNGYDDPVNPPLEIPKGKGEWVKIYLYRGNTRLQLIDSYSLPNENWIKGRKGYNFVIPTAGTYTIKVEVRYLEPDKPYGKMLLYMSDGLTAYHPGAGNYSHFGDGGMAISQGTGNFLHFGSKGLSIGEKTSFPGVLCAGVVTRYGSVIKSWGAHKHQRGIDSHRVEQVATGQYKIHHRIGHSEYIPMLTPYQVRSMAMDVQEISDYYFTVRCWDTSGKEPWSDGFTYACFGAGQ